MMSWRDVALVVIQFNFAVGAIVAAVGMPALNPLMFALIRESAAGAVLTWCAHMTSFPRWPEKEDWRRLVMTGCCVAGTQLFGIVGLKLSSRAVDFALWQPTQPAAVAAASIAIGWEAPQRKRLGGIACAAAGCLLSAASSAQGGARSRADVAANACFAASCASGAAYQMLAKSVLDRYPSLCVAAWCYDVAAVIVAFASVAAWPVANGLCPDCRGKFWRVPVDALPAVAWWIVMSTVVNYALQVWAIKHSSPTLVAASSALQPVIVAALTFVALALAPRLACSGHKDVNCLAAPSPLDAAACVLVLSGLWLVVTTERRYDDPSKLLDDGELGSINDDEDVVAEMPASPRTASLLHRGLER